MYTDYFLKFPDQATAEGVLFDGGGEDLPHPVYRNFDVIGAIDGVDGYHVNVRLAEDEDASQLDPYVITPATPVRVWL